MIGLVLAACGDRTEGSGSPDPTTTSGTNSPGSTAAPTTDAPTTEPPTTTPGTDAGDLEYDAAPDAEVVWIGFEGGFVPAEFDFARLPNLLLVGDGRAFTQAPVTLQYPGALVAPVNVQTVDPEGIHAILALAETAGLLGKVPDYASKDAENIADASTTVVRLTVDGTTYEHKAYALGFLPEGAVETPARAALKGFVDAVSSLSTAAGAGHVTEAAPFAPEEYRIRATEHGTTPPTDQDPAPTVTDWPSSTGVVLADSAECVVLPASQADVLTDAKSNTYFREGELLYTLAVATVLPGDEECGPRP